MNRISSIRKDWKLIETLMKENRSILDIGCGDGKYGTRYKKLLNKKLKSYSGLDVYKNKDFPNEFTHILDKAENCFLHLKGINLVVSQSALQHIEQDRKVLEVITSNLSKSHPFIQIHLVPAFASLWLRLWHGWRIYSQKNLGSIAASLSSTNKVNIEVVPLGGLRCFVTHFTRITIPEFLGKLTNRSSKVDWENESSKTSIEIKNAIETIFKVKVNKVNTLILRGKGKTFKGQYGFRKDSKRAIVTLDEGNTIDSSLEIK